MRISNRKPLLGFNVVLGNERAQVAFMTLRVAAREGGPHNSHRGADQWLYVISGSGRARIGKRSVSLKTSTLLLIEKGERHEIINTGTQPLRTLNFYVPKAYTRAGDELPAGRPKSRKR